ncbi:uncharacterized protein K444DRAFT_531790 [Hyaloscypha bicolor E]|uniref:Uncharacterized protein n=1 Tax=Hyaloscypha bicolor E TaxID=1095630 RepID=A0A2J6T6J0_9HELO|nr:uncharacterized protein K444DRAFT_531790 [Hyaloscypha bicolor E]PMD58645.1 hypothetical protein K444DRAFT_531790 [Hyaloscypha bicolor E]
MFFGCISGNYGKGEGLFWEKAGGSINTTTYYQYTVPVILKYVFNHTGLHFKQDCGPGHGLKASLKYILSLLDREVHRNYTRLKRAVQGAWDSLTDAEIRDSIHTMHVSCEAMFAAHGLYTEY